MIMYKKAFVILMLLSALILKAQDKEFNIHEFYPVENSHSYIEFSVKYMGFAKVKGNFEKFNGTFRYDENDIYKTSISMEIEVNSIDTDNDNRDRDLKSKNWFDVENFSKITFVSEEIKSNTSGFDIVGNLTIKDVTKEVIFKMNPASGVLQDTRGDFQVILTGETSINRTDFGVAGERWSKIREGITGVADNVKIEISILGKQIKLRNQKNWVRDETRHPGKIYKAISDTDVMAGLKVFEKLRSDSANKLNSRILNIVGQTLLKEGKLESALKVFKRNLEVFSDESDLYNSYAEALAVSGNFPEAKLYYQKALEKNKDDQNASEILRHLKVKQ